MKLNAGKWYIPGFDKNTKILETVDQYFNEWVGEAHETVFGVNILIINPTNVVISEYNKRTVDALERYGITAHISPFRHKGNEFLLNIIQESRRASMVMLGIITTLRICCVLKSGTPSANRLGTNLKIVRSTVKGDTVFLHSPINKGNNVTPLG